MQPRRTAGCCHPNITWVKWKFGWLWTLTSGEAAGHWAGSLFRSLTQFAETLSLRACITIREQESSCERPACRIAARGT